MPYFGKSPEHGNFTELTDVSGSFDGSTTQFALTTRIGGIAITPVVEAALLISLNGVIQEPTTAYTVSGTNITFTSAPASTDEFFGVVMGRQLDVGTPSDSTVTQSKLASTFLTGATDIGAAIVDADLLLIDDGAGGTFRKTAASRLKTYVEASAMSVTGNVTATGTVEPAGDTAAGDNAAIGYTAGEGLILTGQGSTNDVTIKNDADADVFTVPTGTTAPEISGQQMPSAGGLWTGRNVVINGEMGVAQRSTSETGLGASGGYKTLDRWHFNGSSAGRFTMTQTADGPSGIANCMKLDCTTADTSIAATETLLIRQHMEGQNLQRFKKGTADAETIAVSFYAKQNESRNIVVYLSDEDNTRHVSSLVTVGTSWARHTITFPADTTGAFDDDNAKSFYLGFYLHAGSNYTSGTLATTWASYTAANIAPGIGSFYASTSNTFFLTGVQMEAGVPTPFEHELYSETFHKCERYFQPKGAGVTGFYNAAATIEIPINLDPPMRTTPTFAVVTTNPTVSNKSNSSTGTQSGVAVVNSSGTANGFYFVQINNCDTDTSASAGHIAQFRTDSFMTFDAEL